MMQQTAIQEWAPIRITLPAAPAAARWSVLAFASVAVPVAMVAAALTQAITPTSTTAPLQAVAPVTSEVAAAASVPVSASDAPAAELPSYFFVDWAAECETECPSRVAE